MKYLLLLLLITFNLSAQISYCGDGKLYFCYAEEYDGEIYTDLYKAQSGKYIKFSSAISNLNSKISYYLKKSKRYPGRKSKYNPIIRNLKRTKVDVIKCRNGNLNIGNQTPTQPNPTPAPTLPPSSDHASACGVIGNQSSFSKIIGGAQCSIGNSPVVYIDLGDGACTGTVVKSRGSESKRTVIFAAHCLEGTRSVRINTPSGQLTASYFAAFPGYDPNSTSGDVAIATFSQEIPTRALHISAAADQRVGENVIIGGYGIDQNNSSSENRLKAAFVTLSNVERDEVSTRYTSISGANTCFGDSGGPLLVNRNNSWELAAVTSNGLLSNCGIGDTSNYASLSNPSVKNWINSIAPNLIN